MDVIYPYRRAGSGEELKYSLRSVEANLPHNNLWVVGDSQTWFSKEVKHIHRSQVGGNKWDNSRANLLAACARDEISDDFVMMNDDFFIMEPLGDELPACHRGPIEKLIEDYRSRRKLSTHMAGLIETLELLRWAGVQHPIYAYNIHMPMVFNKSRLIECTDYLRALKPKTVPQCFHLRTWYGNFWQLDGIECEDVKVSDVDSPTIPKGPFISTTNAAFANRRSVVGPHIRRTFKRKSQYER